MLCTQKSIWWLNCLNWCMNVSYNNVLHSFYLNDPLNDYPSITHNERHQQTACDMWSLRSVSIIFCLSSQFYCEPKPASLPFPSGSLSLPSSAPVDSGLVCLLPKQMIDFVTHWPFCRPAPFYFSIVSPSSPLWSRSIQTAGHCCVNGRLQCASRCLTAWHENRQIMILVFWSDDTMADQNWSWNRGLAIWLWGAVSTASLYHDIKKEWVLGLSSLDY